MQERAGIPHDTLPRSQRINYFDQFASGRNDKPRVALDLLFELARRPTGVTLKNSEPLLPAFTRLGIRLFSEGPECHERGIFTPLETREEVLISADRSTKENGNPCILFLQTLQWTI